jgi:ubiquinone biosynthesis protein COQ9
VHSSTVLFWLGDQSEGSDATWAFLDRRIEDVMRIEKVKAAARANPLARAMFWGPSKVLDMVKPPRWGRDVETGTKVGLPG